VELTGVVDELRELTIVVDKEVHHPVEDEYTVEKANTQYCLVRLVQNDGV
jgi:hypothetical protein